MDKAFLEGVFAKANGARIFVIGDVMLDRYLFGEVNRISPEAPVQVFDIRSSEHRLGGAANVALNVKTLGAEPVLVGVTGEDNEGEMLARELQNLGINSDGLITEKDRPTTSKTRVISDSHHLIRIDSESKTDIADSTGTKLIQFLNDNLREGDVLILEDYNKGVLTAGVISRIISSANERSSRVLVDPKFENFFEYQGVYLFKPNRKELEDATGVKFRNQNEIDANAASVLDRMKCDNLILTLGEHGMLILEKTKDGIRKEIIGTKARKVADVSGAGDTVISTIAVCLSGGAGIRDAAFISNYAAGLVVEEVGIVPVKKDKLIENIVSGH